MLYWHLALMVVFLLLAISSMRRHDRWREMSRLGWVNDTYVKDRLKEARELIVFNLVFAAAMGWFAYLNWTRV